ncbi:FecR family protein [Pedobacter westerhofensis]|uniref:FecR family protein n=1 Tax=Pedobacter westerhofensis TaxID=425512 RepID=A0A521BBN3_9SPHI|nr:FecR domain-containing protein [Pedobacter westerhofensis]SMO44160.1 FecR family protein [Pedobacter westerhofensis]
MEVKNRISVLFSKYVAGEANKAEVAEFLELIKREDADLDTEMEHLWNRQDTTVEHDVDWQRIYDLSVASDPEVTPLRSNRRIWLSVAAMLIGVCALAFWFNPNKNLKDQNTEYVSGKAGAGKMLVVHLSDGTKVTLNSGSELLYPETFDANKREVYLNGEAYFEVAHNPSKSFLVHSGKVVTSVLGTSFNVMAYPEMSKMSVTVLSGKVAVKNTSSQKLVTLLPKQRASMNIDKDDFDVDSLKDAAEMIAWSKGELTFDNATLEEIALKVGNKFGISVSVLNKEKKQRRITGTFNKQSFIEILNAVTHLTETTYKQTKDDYIIY